ncbi:hypothetical protein INT44_007465 [Umbelopsis vinacea]|uniref:Uncharacterized protein n=1 Tax=Umbelopsis vinacea TaxID=44442 RepID=A0A8H7PMT3_9FUNG|nr:hypothetical protein INT44_007465 [Umbelopsis vinacea]KAI9284501.1 hypothetical protein BC943DRAFT_279439 [Umbelopsis sp. AD052]
MTTNNNSSVSNFLLDPWSPIKIALPSVAIQAVLHYTVLEKLPIRSLTLALSLVNTYWFASTLNQSFLDTPITLLSSTDDKVHSANVGRLIFNWLNKLEIAVSVVSLDLYCVWRQKIIDRGGFIDKVLVATTLLPPAIVLLQSSYLLPTLNKRADKMIKGLPLEPSSVHKQYIGFEVAKVVGLAVAGLRFGKLLTH